MTRKTSENKERTNMLEITVGHKCVSKSVQSLKYSKQTSVKHPLCTSTHIWQFYRLNVVKNTEGNKNKILYLCKYWPHARNRHTLIFQRRSTESIKKWEPCHEETQHNFVYDICHLARTEKLAAADSITTVSHPQTLQSPVL